MTEIDKKPPKISVVLPVHSADPYLALALDSLLAQTFKDFEIIAINDGSTDLSGKILNEYALKDSRIRVFHRAQRGLVVTLNEGIDLARGEWIARMDADDIALPRRFELQLEHLFRTEPDFCGGAVQCFGDSRAIWRYPESNEAIGIQLLFNVPFAHPTVIGRAAAFRKLRYNSSFTHAEDYDLWQRAWTSGYQCTNVSDVVLRYRVHQNQVTFKRKNEQKKIADLVRINHWLHLYPDLGKERLMYEYNEEKFNKKSTELMIKGMQYGLLNIPESMHNIYLKGSLGILMRVAGNKPYVLFFWFKLYKSKNINLLYTKFSGILILLFLSAFRINSHTASFLWIRRIKNRLLSW